MPDPATTGVMIDRPGSADRDDAIWVTPDGDGWRAYVHIADVARVIHPRTLHDREAATRCWSVYRPDRTIGMLPTSCEQAASLTTTPAPTCLIELSILPDGQLADTRISRGRLTHGRPMGHAEVQAVLDAASVAEPAEVMLRHAHDAARVLYARRREAGALAIYDLVRGLATDEEGHLVRVDAPESNAAYVIVQELMVAANQAVARWCAGRDLPVLFRNHRASAVAPPRDQLLNDLLSGTTSVDTARERAALTIRAAEYGPTTSGHYGLNVPAYTHCTSPLRRYADLVTQRIVLAAVDGRPSPYTADQLQAIAEGINTKTRERRERKADRLKEAARRASRQHIAQETYEGLDADAFHKVIKVATRENRLTGPLAQEIDRRAGEGSLAPRDLCRLLFFPQGEQWAPVKDRALSVLTDDPAKAVTAVTMYAQLVDAAPPTIEDTDVGTVQGPVFASTITLTTAGTTWTSPARLAAGKRQSRQQAALALAAHVAGLPDPSRDLTNAPAPADDTERPPGRNPVMTVNEAAQTGRLRDVTWAFSTAGPAHARTFRCAATAVCGATGRPVSGEGTAGSKASAKSAAAESLLAAAKAAHPARTVTTA